MSDEKVLCKLRGQIYIYPLTFRTLVQLEQMSGRSMSQIFDDLRMEDIYRVVYITLRNNRVISRLYTFNKFLREAEHVSVERVNFNQMSIDDFLRPPIDMTDDGEPDE